MHVATIGSAQSGAPLLEIRLAKPSHRAIVFAEHANRCGSGRPGKVYLVKGVGQRALVQRRAHRVFDPHGALSPAAWAEALGELRFREQLGNRGLEVVSGGEKGRALVLNSGGAKDVANDQHEKIA